MLVSAANSVLKYRNKIITAYNGSMSNCKVFNVLLNYSLFLYSFVRRNVYNDIYNNFCNANIRDFPKILILIYPDIHMYRVLIFFY